MLFCEWEPVYIDILKDLRMDRTSDEASAKLLKMLTLNSNMISDDELASLIGNGVIVAGGGVSGCEAKLLGMAPKGPARKRTLISAGSATDVLVANGVIPDIVVTDLDGNAELQKKASSSGSVTMIHAHGDNSHLIMAHAKDFKGPIMITTQSAPDMILCNFGGFTDGDRAVCTARHFGAKDITLIGFDFDAPSDKPGTDPEMKKRKLAWAKRIIHGMNPPDVTITSL
ncbi:MAG: DUF115 domain-containing protein [Methanomassiliicoccaceae archaeon]|jgi:uncharacterized Rossmann fold enzyme|nr:DUF115 domain-containing protein [Methanomassiliicoccaceae archaeon]